MPRVALSDEQREEYKIADLPFLLEKEARRRGMCQKDLARALGITPQALGHRKKKLANGKPRDSFTYGEMLKLFRLFEFTEEEKLKLFQL